MSEINIENAIQNESDIFKSIYEKHADFAKAVAASQKIRDLTTSSARSESVSFSTISKDQLLTYLKSPTSNEKNIRNASISMYNTSTHYRRLIDHYAGMPLWAYTISSIAFDDANVDEKSYRKQYLSAAAIIERMNLKHELHKALKTALREGIFYGAAWISKDSFFIQRINPDICQLSSIEDGTWMYAVDMSQIKEADLIKYPPEFTSMYNEYVSDGLKYKEVPSTISFCLKADETTIAYSLPPWASSMSLLLDIENYKELQATESEIANYKLMHMKVPTNDEGSPLFPFNIAKQYYDHLCKELPPFVGASMAPMELQDYDFQNSGGLNSVDVVSRAENQFWSDTGSSPLLFGSAVNNTAGALKISVMADEELVFNWMNQCERLINRILKQQNGKVKFKISFLPVTIYSQERMAKLFKEASTLGIPLKSAYASTLGLNPIDIRSSDYIERNILKMDELVPLSSSYNTSASDVGAETGRPAETDDNLGEAGEKTKAADSNENR